MRLDAGPLPERKLPAPAVLLPFNWRIFQLCFFDQRSEGNLFYVRSAAELFIDKLQAQVHPMVVAIRSKVLYAFAVFLKA